MGARRIVTVASAALLLVTLAPASTSTAVACSEGWTFRATETGLAELINLTRKGFGKRQLRLDPELSRAARKHTAEMMRKKTLYHTPLSVLGRRVTRWYKLGENVGIGKTIETLHKAFMQSPTHRSNILYPKFRHVGIGMKEGRAGSWVTVLFESRRDPGTTLPMPSC